MHLRRSSPQRRQDATKLLRSGFLVLVLSLIPYPDSLGQDLKRAIIFGEQVGMSQGYVNKEVDRNKSSPLLGARDAFNKGDEFFSKGNFSSAFMWYNVGFDHFLSLMNPKKDTVAKSEKINVYTQSERIIAERERALTVERALENGNYSYFGKEEFWEFTRGLEAAAMYYQVKGNYDKAEMLYLKSLAMRGEQFGKTSEPYVCTLGNLATLRMNQGSLAASEDILNYLEKLYRQVKGKESAEYVITMNNKAMLEARMGRLEKASAMLPELLKNQAVIGFNVLDAERIRTNQALLLAANNKQNEAIALLTDVIQVLEKNKLDNHPDSFTIAIYLGRIHMSASQRERGQLLIDAAIKKISNTLGTAHPVYFDAKSAMVDSYMDLKMYSEALTEINTLLPVMESKYGIRNKSYLDVVVKGAYCQWKTNDIRGAMDRFLPAMREYIRMTDALFTSLSEAEQSAFWSMLKPQLDLFYLFAAENFAQFPDLPEQAFDLNLRTKGLLINNSRNVKERILKSKDAQLTGQFKQWQRLKESMTIYYSMRKEDLDEQGINVQDVENQVNDLEKSLVQVSSSFAHLEAAKGSFKSVQQSIEPGEVAVEVIRVKALLGEDQTVKYISLVVSPSGMPVLTLLKEGDGLESRDIAYYRNFIALGGDDRRSGERYWNSLLKGIPKNSTVYFSADGVYHNVSLNTMRNQDGRFLIDEYKIVSLSSTRLLAGYKSRTSQVSVLQDAMLIGGPDFGASGTVPALPGALAEIEQVGEILQNNRIAITRLTRGDATKSAFQSMPSPEVLHVATHGFFLRNPVLDDARGIVGHVSTTADNPLFRSGLLLAGASGAVGSGGINVAGEGVVTAYEAMNLDLERTRLVVLSACETGLGQVVNGEGVYGLIRAMQLAGAKAQIMSLWKVDDRATQHLMTNFYSLFVKSGDLAGSFRKAQQDLRKVYPDPMFWGAFVLYE